MGDFSYADAIAGPASIAFAQAVAISRDGNVLAVGAWAYDGSATDQGGVYVYDRSGTTWVPRGSVLVAADAATSDRFGASVALSADGSVLAVGARSWEGTATDQGAVYVYDWSGSAWVQRGAVLTAADRATSDFFGASVALSGNGAVLTVGAVQWEGSATDQGGVYTYDWFGSAWVQRGTVLTVLAYLGGFGCDVALSEAGAVLAVGQDSSGSGSGVYVYDWSGSAWVQRGAAITLSSAMAGLRSALVSLSGDGSVLAIGEPGYDGAVTDQGAVYVYDWSGSAWVQRGAILASPTPDQKYFGRALALSRDGTTLAVGSDAYTGTTYLGSYVYLFSAAVAVFWTNLFGQREVA